MVERHNKTMQQCIKACIEDRQEDWVTVLDSIAMSLRGSQQGSTNKTPFEMMYGRQMLLPIQLRTKPLHMQTNDCDDGDETDAPIPSQEEILDHMLQTRDRIHKAAGINILIAQEKQKAAYDERHKGVSDLQVGDEILKEEQVQKGRKGGKLVNPWEGPYTIDQVHDNGTYTIRNGKGERLKRKVPCDQVKKYLKENRKLDKATKSFQLSELIDSRNKANKSQTPTTATTVPNDLPAEELPDLVENEIFQSDKENIAPPKTTIRKKKKTPKKKTPKKTKKKTPKRKTPKKKATTKKSFDNTTKTTKSM